MKPFFFIIRGCLSLIHEGSNQISQIRKLYGFSIFSSLIFLFATSCFFPAPKEGMFYLNKGWVSWGNEVASSPPPIVRDTPKKPDPVKQGECKRRGRSDCEGDEDCEEICDDIFSRRSDKQECYEYSSEMVLELEDLIEATEDGDVDEIAGIGSDVLECMLDIDETAFAKAVKKMSRREAQDFVVLIAEDEGFAGVLEEEDDEFNILRQLASRLVGGGGLKEALSEEVEDDRTILWLFAEGNEPAWEWLDSYVDEECDGRDSVDCPGGENIGSYCRALLESGFRESEWKDFLSDTDLFADEYEDEVEDEDYEYEITDSPGRDYEGDFRDYCELKAGNRGDPPPAKPGPCPDGNPTANQILADFELEVKQSHRYYQHRTFRTSHNNIPLGGIGSTDYVQDIVLQINLNIRDSYDQFYIIYLDDDEISYVRSKDYYFYIDGERYEIRRGESASHETGGIKHGAFRVRGYPKSGRLESFELAIASFDGDQCQFYRN